jgi:hypothetical protein
MAIILHLGVVDLPYSEAPKSRGRKPRKVKSGTQTTGDVATWLENRYHPMEHFAQLHGQDVIAPALEDALAGALETVMMGGPPSSSLFASAGDKIAEGFRTMIEKKELDSLGYPGIPTQASLDGASQRFKRRRGQKGRPSFVDTGLYVNSARAWVD